MAVYFGEICSLHPDRNGERYEGTNRCAECSREKTRLWRKNNPEKMRAQNEKYLKPWLAKNKEKVLEYGRKNSRKWRENHPEKVVAMNSRPENVAKRSAARSQDKRANVSWANEFFIREIYDLAAMRTKMTGIRWVVDHIVPFKSDRVCGLHCEANMQIITFNKNSGKGNRYWPDM